MPSDDKSSWQLLASASAHRKQLGFGSPFGGLRIAILVDRGTTSLIQGACHVTKIGEYGMFLSL